MEYTLDADNKILGRLATRIAILLRGKNTPAFHPRQLAQIRVVVRNTDKLRVTGRKLTTKLYRRHSGYPGGFREETLARLMERDSRRVLRFAVSGMLPKNKLRQRMLRNLILHK